MTDRDRLIELIKQATTSHLDYLESIDQKGLTDTNGKAKFTADYLLANGVIVPPCKVGDVVYVIMETSCEDIDLVHTVCEFYNEKHEDLCTLTRGKCPYKYIIRNCEVDKSNILSFSERFGKTVFLTKEEAEEKLKELNGNDFKRFIY